MITRANSGLNSIRVQPWVQQPEREFPKSLSRTPLSKPARSILIRVSIVIKAFKAGQVDLQDGLA